MIKMKMTVTGKNDSDWKIRYIPIAFENQVKLLRSCVVNLHSITR